jgi:glycosyltransferase involved in cell wall biosynthesis
MLAAHYPFWVRAVVRELETRQVSQVVAFDLDAALGCVLARKSADCRIVYDVADNFYLRHNFPAPISTFLKRAERYVLGNVDLVLVPDPSRVTEVEAPFAKKIEVIYNCPSSAHESESGIKRDNTAFLLSGYLTPTRGCGMVLEAIRRTPSARLLVAGQAPSSSLRRSFEQTPRSEFRGQLSYEESLRLFSESAAVFTLYDPKIEINRRAASNKWFDAMMSSTPVIANAELEAAKWIENEGIGYLVPYGDARSLSQCLQAIIDDPRDAQERGKRGRHLFETRYNWELMEKQLDEAFKRSAIPLPATITW